MKRENIDKAQLNEIMEHHLKHQTFRENDQHKDVIVESVLGEKLRSRAEGILSTVAMLFHMPYLYEAELALSSGKGSVHKKTVRPDFKFFINGKPVFLELLGRIHDEKYMQAWRQKQRRYERSGYKLGKNLVCIACNNEQSLKIQKIAHTLMSLKHGAIPESIVYV